MYQYDPNKKIEANVLRGTAFRAETRKFFQAKAVGQKQEQADKFSTQKKSFISMSMNTISKGLDYLSTFNPLESAEAIGGMVKESLTAAKKFVNAPREIYKITQYMKEVKELDSKRAGGKISEEAYKSRMGTISGDARKISQEYDPKTAVSDALSASMLIPGAGFAKTIVGGGGKFLLRGGAKEAVKGITKESIKKGITPTVPKATGFLSRTFQKATSTRPISTPIGKTLFKASTKLAEGKAIADTFSKVTGKEITPIKFMKEGYAREAVKLGGMLISPIPFVGKAFQEISKTKKYIATATETQAGESAFRKYFGKAIDDMAVFKDNKARAGAEAYITGVMKEKGIAINEKNIAKFLDDIYSPKIKDLPMVSNSIKRILSANGIEKIEDISKMTDEMLEGVLKDKKGIKAIREAIDEMGKTSFTGMHFKTPEEKLKALAVFGYKGVHSGTWRGTIPELKAEITKSYDEIIKGIKGEAKIEGPLKGLKFEGAPVPVTKFKSSEDLLETLNKKTAGTIKAIEDMRKAKIETIGSKGILKVKAEIKEIKEMRRQLQKASRGTRAIRTQERTAADAIIKELEKKFADLSEIAVSVKKQASAKLAAELEAKTKQVFKSQLPKTTALAKAPERISEFVIKHKKKEWGGWTSKTAEELGFDNLFSQGVRELPKGNISFMEGKKAELGRIINRFKEGRAGKLLTPQNSREIYQGIRGKLDKSIVQAFGKDSGKAEKLVHKILGEPLLKTSGKTLLPIFKPTERELGYKVWKDIASQITGKSLDSADISKMARKLDKDARAAFVTSMTEAGIPTNIVDKMRSASGFYNWAYYNLYTLPRFQLRAGFWWQQVPEVYEWGTVRASKYAQGSLIRQSINKQVDLRRTLNRSSDLTDTQKIIEGSMLGQTEDITVSGVRGMKFHKRNEANAYGMATIIEADKALNSMPVVKNYLKKHGLKSAEEIPYLKNSFYAPLADDAEELGKIIDKYGFGGAKAHLADPTKTVLEKGRESAVFDNAIREALKISKPNAYKEAIPMFLYNPNRSMLEKSLHAWPMFPLSYSLKLAERGGGYILEGKAIRSKIFASIINVSQQADEDKSIQEMERKYYNLFNAAKSWSPMDPSYDFSTGFLPPFSKMLLRWAENPEYYLDEKDGMERSMKVLWPAYREARGWQQLYNNVKRMQDKVRRGDTMTEAEAKSIIEGFRYKEPTKIGKVKLPELSTKPQEKTKVKDFRTAQERTFAEKKARRKKLVKIKQKKEKKTEKFIPKISVPKTKKPEILPLRPPYSK